MGQENAVARTAPLPPVVERRRQRNDDARSLARLAGEANGLPLPMLAERPPCREIAELLPRIEAALEPAGEKQAAVMIDVVAETLQAPVPSEAALKNYLKLLGSLPEDLLDLATHRVLAEYRYAGFPKPADWLERVKPELEQRRNALMAALVYQQRRKVAVLYYPISQKYSES
jgi:hypothetical protein